MCVHVTVRACIGVCVHESAARKCVTGQSSAGRRYVIMLLQCHAAVGAARAQRVADLEQAKAATL
jgi:hypothetical protein